MALSKEERKKMPVPTSYAPGMQIDHYRIVRSLGEGFANRVYLAYDLVSRQNVILKYPRDEMIGGKAIFAAYRREVEVGKRLSHPSLQCLLYADEPRQGEYLVLEYLPGRSLRAVLREQEHCIISVEQLIPLLLPVCDALSYVHSQGIIHRDLKPENILVGEQGEVKVVDFGIALLKEEQSSAQPWRAWLPSIDLVGTPAYMSPERLRGESGDERCDIYALGIMLYEALCGRTPFADPDGFSLTNHQMAYDPPDILQFNPSLSPALATVIMHAIRCDPSKRYASAQELAEDLHHLDDVVVTSYVPDVPLWGGRYRQLISIALITLIVCLLLVGFGMLAQFAHHAAP
jgi:serine/threonine-protein kinase